MGTNSRGLIGITKQSLPISVLYEMALVLQDSTVLNVPAFESALKTGPYSHILYRCLFSSGIKEQIHSRISHTMRHYGGGLANARYLEIAIVTVAVQGQL
jgi:hypothetical protein